MAGHVIFNYFNSLPEKYEVFGVARNIDADKSVFSLDVSDTEMLKNIITQGNFDAVINCIGILNKDAEDHPDKAVWFNSFFPHFLEAVTKNLATRVVHISTDCVFSGKDHGGYTEDSFKNGIGYYAQSKALGEIVNNKDITLRTSIIGPELNPDGIGLLHWFLTQPESAELSGFSEVFWSGITTLELAKVIEDVLENNVTGLKVISREKIDKYSLLLLFNKIFREDRLSINSSSDYKSDKSLISIRTDYVYHVPEYEKMLLDLKNVMLQNPLYNHYG